MNPFIITDEWYTPIGVYADVVHFLFGQPGADIFIDPTCSAEAFERVMPLFEDHPHADFSTDAESVADGYDVMFCNPPYSRASGGAEKFVRMLRYKATHSLFLVNYGSWVGRLGGNPAIGLVHRRIAFEPSKDLAEHLAAEYARKHPNKPAKTQFDSPRYDNVFIYYGPLKYRPDRLPASLGGYDITWMRV